MRGPFGLVIAAGLALLIVGILFSLAPTVGGSVEDAQPALSPSSSWNATHNTNLVEGGNWFSDNQTWVTLTFLGIVAGIIIAMFMRW
jgi:hypothetical protein